MKLDDFDRCAAAKHRMLAIKIATLLLLVAAVGSGNTDFIWMKIIGFDHGWLLAVGMLMFVFSSGYLALLLFLAFFRYRAVPAASDAELPDCTVILPAYNEGRGVLRALESVLASHYPTEKLHVIAIDDGSEDDTWKWISEAAAAAPGRIEAVRQPVNGGKRRALYYGFLHASGEIVVTVDSDSVVTPDTIRNLVAPLADPLVGGVAGAIRVANPDEGALPRMMEVSFAFNFEIVRASQSTMRTVFCTPGALSAYRRSALLPFIGEWVDQRFFGRPAGIGEDRAVSTRLLRDRHRIVYQRNAVAYTKVPCDFPGLCKMYMRWCRGDVRETFSMYRFAFRKFSLFDLAVQFNILAQTMLLTMPLFLLPVLIAGCYAAPHLFLSSMGLATIICGTIPAIVYLAVCKRKSDALWGYTFSIFNFFFLFWMVPYCFVTVGNSRWMTRSLCSARRGGRAVSVSGRVVVEGRSTSR